MTSITKGLNMILDNSAVVVTGAGSGIGFGIASALTSRRCKIIIADINYESAESVAEKLTSTGSQVYPVQCDVSNYESVENLAEIAWTKFGSVCAIFNNAGVASSKPIIDTDPLEVDWMLNVNFKGVWNGCSVFGKRFISEEKPACIAITASEHALGTPHPGIGIYTATKHAILGMADVLRQELPSFINLSITFPGVVQTRLYEATRNSPVGPSSEEQIQFFKQVMSHGMDPLEIGSRAVKGVEDGTFMVMTHPHVHDIALRRWQQIAKAIEEAPSVTDPKQYEAEAIMAKVMNPLIPQGQ
jgi:NAD(P)-dependent dehydrogenase (short-subunit alcohol dehydrogenase family)